ncbi:hypothetical protein OsJ_26999 [Oryza sativa Japonica Group]|uniref:Uncharacterized protein n=1 Tax=Oryza sativa subsp. japonica TaxID=39947 RepID=A3BS83_ORYSJ|nr:hypothetical protein OsJ_26999 [Oryza sativa Japonica Group]
MATATGTSKPVATLGGGGSSSGASTTGTNQGGDDRATGTSHPVPAMSFTGGLAQSMSHYIYTTSIGQAGGCHKGKVKGYSNSKPNQQGTTNYGNSYKENNAQSAASSYYNGSASKGSSTGRMPEQQNSDHQYYISSMSSNHGQQGGGGAENSTYTSKSIRTKKFPSLNG